MNKIKNFLGSLVFFASSAILAASMDWITHDESRLAAINRVVELGKAAEKAKARWNTLTKN